jgi:hypothetical protein
LVEHAIEEYHLQSEDRLELGLKDKFFIFDVLLDNRYPFNSPQFFCRSAFSRPPLNDGRDVYKDILKGDWKETKRLFEMVQYIPEFMVDTLVGEKEGNGILLDVFGSFHLGS